MARQKYLLSNIYYNHMVLSEEQRQALRERMVLARQAKVAKANLKNGVQQAPVPSAPSAPSAPVIAPSATPVAPVPPVAKKVKMPVADLDDEPIRTHAPSTPRAKAEPHVEKQKFAKLVFYKEPTAKAQKKLAKIMNDESSDDEPQALAVPSAPAAAAAPQKTEADYRQERYEKMKKLANQFF